MIIWAVTVVLSGVIAPTSAPDELLVDDFEGGGPGWRSKFSTHVIEQAERGAEPTKALRVPYDLRTGPQYLWVRAMCDPPLDARPYAYLSFRLRGDGGSGQLTAMLMQRRPPEEGGSEHGEVVAAANQRPVLLDSEDWQQLSIPLSAFDAPEDIVRAVGMVNFSLKPARDQLGPGSFWLDDVAFVGPEPRGEVVPEDIPYPPADIAIRTDEALLEAMDLSRPELREVAEAAERGDMAAAKEAWARHLATRTEPRWLWSHRDRERIVAAHEQHFGGLAKYAPSADSVLNRDFNWLGVRKKLEHDIEWLQGPVEWTHVLSRFGYWLNLGKAYWGTGDPKYAEDFVFTLHDWIRDNPVPRILTNSRGERGTVWRTLETGIRGYTWPEVMEFFMEAPEFDAEAKWAMTRSLVEQARHLHRYETGFRYGNWQVVECTGLASIGIMFPELREAPGWRERAFHWLLEHMRRDVYDDGAHYEVTPGYHSWVMELFLRASLLAKQNGYEVPGLLEKHERMFEFLMKLSRPNRHVPSLGDGGLAAGSNISGQMALGALLYDRPDMRFLGVEKPMEQWLWLLGEEALSRYTEMAAHAPDFNSTYLPNAGYYVMRTGWEANDSYLLFDCAPWGGGHSHADRLSICAYARGEDLIIDPGMYSYDQPLSREYLRFGQAHNVLLIDGEEQPSIDPEPLAFDFSEGFDFVSGQLDHGERAIRQVRSVMFVRPDYWVLVDHVLGEGEHQLRQLFHLPLGANVELSGARAVVTLRSGLRFLLAGAGAPEPAAQLLEGWVPTGGASVEKGPVVAFDARASLPCSLAVVLYPLDDGDAEVQLSVVRSEDDLVALQLARPGAREVFAFAPEPRPLVENVGAPARAACISQRGDDRRLFVVNDGSSTTH